MITTTTPAALSIASQFLKTESEITAWLDSMGVKNYTLVPDNQYGFVVDVSGNVDLENQKLYFIPVKFNHVQGYFDCDANYLKSLAGCPEVVNRGFYCDQNFLTSLEHCPKKVGGNFRFCYNKNLTSLEHCPEVVGGDFLSHCFDHNDYKEYNEQRKAIKAEKELFESMQLTCTSSKKRSNKI